MKSYSVLYIFLIYNLLHDKESPCQMKYSEICKYTSQYSSSTVIESHMVGDRLTKKRGLKEHSLHFHKWYPGLYQFLNLYEIVTFNCSLFKLSIRPNR